MGSSVLADLVAQGWFQDWYEPTLVVEAKGRLLHCHILAGVRTARAQCGTHGPSDPLGEPERTSQVVGNPNQPGGCEHSDGVLSLAHSLRKSQPTLWGTHSKRREVQTSDLANTQLQNRKKRRKKTDRKNRRIRQISEATVG